MRQPKKEQNPETPRIHIESSGEGSDKEREEQEVQDITAIVPLRGRSEESIDGNVTLIRKCLESLKESKSINRLVITTDDEKLLKSAEKFTEFVSILRPESLSVSGIRVQEVLQYTLQELHKQEIRPDILVPVEITYPFRPAGLFDALIEMYNGHDYDTVIAGVPEYRVCWKEGGDGFESVTDQSIPRKDRSPLYIGLPSLGCVIDPELVLKGKRYGEKLGIYQVDEPFATVEIRTPQQLNHIARQLYWPVE